MSALYPYSYGDTLLKIDHVYLSASADGNSLLTKPMPGSRAILTDVCAEIKKIKRPNQIQGQMVGLLGPSGRGKTQLFRIISGLNKPTSGQVLINGKAVPVVAGEVGVVAQDYQLFAHRTVMGNLTLAAEKKEKDAKTAHEKIMTFLNEFGIADKINLYPAQLSGGQKQRVAIIQQILSSSYFLLMDEPFSGLDIIMEDKMLQLIMKIANMDDLNCVIVVTHDVTAAASVCDHIWALGWTPGGDKSSSIVKTYDLIER